MTKVLRLGCILHLQEWDFFVGATPNAIRAWAECITLIASGSEKAEGSTLRQCPRLSPLALDPSFGRGRRLERRVSERARY